MGTGVGAGVGAGVCDEGVGAGVRDSRWYREGVWMGDVAQGEEAWGAVSGRCLTIQAPSSATLMPRQGENAGRRGHVNQTHGHQVIRPASSHGHSAEDPKEGWDGDPRRTCVVEGYPESEQAWVLGSPGQPSTCGPDQSNDDSGQVRGNSQMGIFQTNHTHTRTQTHTLTQI